MPTILTLGEPFEAPLFRHPTIPMKDGSHFSVASLYKDMPGLVAAHQRADMVREGRLDDGIWTPSEHCGWIIPPPLDMSTIDWELDVPEDMYMTLDDFWYTDGFGPESTKIQQLIANGGRKLFGLSMAAPEYMSTLAMQSEASQVEDDEAKFVIFPGPYVESVDDNGQTLWGVFPWGGAVIVVVGKWAVGCGLSGYTAPQDHLLATTIATRFAEWLDANEDNILEIPWAA